MRSIVVLFTHVCPFVLEPTLKLPFPKGMLNLAACANYLWIDSRLHCHQFQGHLGSRPIFGPRPGRKRSTVWRNGQEGMSDLR